MAQNVNDSGGGSSSSNNDLSTHPGKAADDKLPAASKANPNDQSTWTPAQWRAWAESLAAQMAGTGSGSGGASAAASLAEQRREFDVTTQRDIAKQNASEVQGLQNTLKGMSGPKDTYADLFFSHGLAAPQGYKPAPVPLTKAQIDAYGKMGVTPQQLQQMLTGTGQPGADTGMLGNMGDSLKPPAGTPGYASAQAPVGPQQASNPTAQGGALYGKAPAGTTLPPTTPGGVPSMAVGGMVPNEDAMPPSDGPSSGGLKSMLPPGLHPAIAQLVDAVSNLLSNPDFRPFVEDGQPAHDGGAPVLAMLHGGEKVTPADEVEGQGQAPQGPAPQTPGGVQSMATGGFVKPPSGTIGNPLGQGAGIPSQPGSQPTSITSAAGASSAGATQGAPSGPIISPGQTGAPLGGAQAVTYNSGSPGPADNPILALDKMDPYTRALYDVHGRLHPYSAQQESQMGPQGTDAVSSYIGTVQGGNVDAYKNLVDKLRPNGAPVSSGAASEGFKWG